MSRKYKCLIVDDHPIFRKGVKDVLLEEGLCHSVIEAASAEEALAAVSRESWDLLVLDVALPDKHGLEVLKEVKSLHPNLPVVMLSLYPEQQFAVRALKAGASCYLTKDQDPAELLLAVKAVLDGRRFITPSLADHLAHHVQAGQPATLHEVLSDREMEVLCLIGQGQTVSAIAKKLALSAKTVSTYRRRLLDKLRLRTTVDLIRYAVEHHLVS